MAVVGYGGVALVPVLFLARALKIAENSADYSLQNTIQQTLFLPTSRAAKYKAKAAIDTFCVRFGDFGSYALVSLALAQQWGGRTLSLVNAALGGLWCLVALLLARDNARRTGLRQISAGVDAHPAQPVRRTVAAA